MNVIAAVLRDLYIFAFKYQLGFGRTVPSVEGKTTATVETRANVTPDKAADEVFVDSLKEAIAEATAPSHVGLLPPSPALDAPEREVYFEGVGYACSPSTPLYALPTRVFDGVIRQLSYGESFQLLGSQGKWCNVEHKDVRGWVHRDDLTENGIELKPQFTIGKVYGATHPATQTLRTFIDDAFHAAALDLPLQDVEYVSYVLSEKGRKIPWPPVRPRIAGTWQRILKGVRGVHMGVKPKTGAVMEYVLENSTGHVAFVDSVYPDEGITISEVGFLAEGEYSERTLSKDEWKELRPIFIQIV